MRLPTVCQVVRCVLDGLVNLRVDSPHGNPAAYHPVVQVVGLHPPPQLSLDRLVDPFNASI